ncbi:hypothetical protein [Sodalis sp.]|uniref:hypothetical protein n=1 Tax=Sodalis sp. (in: enterobacteria) TaxID=1898979 RepID=UPI003872FF27
MDFNTINISQVFVKNCFPPQLGGISLAALLVPIRCGPVNALIVDNDAIPWLDSKFIALNGAGNGIYDIRWNN